MSKRGTISVVVRRTKLPKQTEEQEGKAKLRAGRHDNFLLKHRGRCIVIDEETYVFLETKLAMYTQYLMAAKGGVRKTRINGYSHREIRKGCVFVAGQLFLCNEIFVFHHFQSVCETNVI